MRIHRKTGPAVPSDPGLTSGILPHTEMMAKSVNLYHAKTHLSDLVERAASGEEIVIAKAGKPMARLVGLPKAKRSSAFGRNLMGVTLHSSRGDAGPEGCPARVAAGPTARKASK